MTSFRLIARPLLAAPFIADGVDALRHPESHADRVRRVEPMLEKVVPASLLADPVPLVRVSGAVTVVAGLMFATGRKPRLAALALAGIGWKTAVVRYPVWQAKNSAERKEHTAGLVARAGLIGGALIAAGDRAGSPSLSRRVAHARQERAKIRSVKARAKKD